MAHRSPTSSLENLNSHTRPSLSTSNQKRSFGAVPPSHKCTEQSERNKGQRKTEVLASPHSHTSAGWSRVPLHPVSRHACPACLQFPIASITNICRCSHSTRRHLPCFSSHALQLATCSPLRQAPGNVFVQDTACFLTSGRKICGEGRFYHHLCQEALSSKNCGGLQGLGQSPSLF